MSLPRLVLSYDQYRSLWRLLHKEGLVPLTDPDVAKTGYISQVWHGIAFTLDDKYDDPAFESIGEAEKWELLHINTDRWIK